MPNSKSGARESWTTELRLSDTAAREGWSFVDRLETFSRNFEVALGQDAPIYRREIGGPIGSTVAISGEEGGETREFLMLGSNNYLGLANSPCTAGAAREALDRFGTSCSGW